uniref:Sacchrp_dh_NADP domain-containing protein n=1 Tax=Caenorhabditis japonica TaxID=281687 RepID=A0A8R1I2Y4_CAEJA
MSRYDVVVYGASGFTGAYVVQNLVASEQFEGLSFAVAGRSDKKLREVLAKVSQKTGKDVTNAAVIIADSVDERSLNEMARQAKVVINAVGPYRLYGETVVKAAVENGANHVDISGEPAWIEKMQSKYSEEAAKQGVYVVSACGWDSIPADLGVNFLKNNFNGDLNHVESFVQQESGPSGYCANAGTYQTLILGLANQKNDQLAEVRKEIMPERIVKGAEKPPKRKMIWEIKEKELGGYAIPFPGADRAVVNRSQYYDATVQHKRPCYIETYFRLESKLWTHLLILWLFILNILVKNSFTRRILQQYPDQCSFYMFKNSGPSKQQVAEASFTYWFFGYGYKQTLPVDEQHEGRPNRKVVAMCKGPDAGYVATSGCVLSAALTIIRDQENLPKRGGVYTTAAAFGQSKIYDYLKSFGITYQLESEYDL